VAACPDSVNVDVREDDEAIGWDGESGAPDLHCGKLEVWDTVDCVEPDGE